MERYTKLVIRHFPDRAKPCICLEQGNQCIVIGTIRNSECEEMWKEFFCNGNLMRPMKDFTEVQE